MYHPVFSDTHYLLEAISPFGGSMMLLIASIAIMWEGYFIWKYICHPDHIMLWIPLFFTVASITGYVCFKIEEKLDK